MNFQDDITLENNRVRLEPLAEKHFFDLVPISNTWPNLLQFSPSPFGTPENLQQNIRIALSARAAENRYPFVIFDKIPAKFVGSTSYGAISTENNRLEIGWTWLAPSVQGSGLNLYCKHLLLQYAFGTLGMERVEFKTDSRNRQSRKAIEKIGGQYEGELRSHTVLPDGYRRNTVYYSILRQEWPGLSANIFKDVQ